MDWLKIAFAGIAGTSLMTVFSYVCQLIFNKKLGEPKILSQFLQKSPLELGNKSRITFWGWVIHYITGFAFAFLLAGYVYVFAQPISWGMAILLGFALGLLGIIGWQILYRIHPDPPVFDRSAFYLQLVVAHIFFGIGATAIYKFWPL